MYLRLLLFLLVGVGVYLAWRAWRQQQAEALPEVPDGWRALAARDPLVEQALDLLQRMAGLTRRAPERRTLLIDVHFAVESVVDLVQRREELRARVADLAADGDLPPAQAEQQAQVLASMETRAGRMDAEARRAVDDLRQVYLDLLQAYEQSAGEGRDAIRRTRDTVGVIRARVAAEQEIREVEAD